MTFVSAIQVFLSHSKKRQLGVNLPLGYLDVFPHKSIEIKLAKNSSALDKELGEIGSQAGSQ